MKKIVKNFYYEIAENQEYFLDSRNEGRHGKSMSSRKGTGTFLKYELTKWGEWKYSDYFSYKAEYECKLIGEVNSVPEGGYIVPTKNWAGRYSKEVLTPPLERIAFEANCYFSHNEKPTRD